MEEIDSQPFPEVQLKEPPRGCKRTGAPFYSAANHKPESMPELLAKSVKVGATAGVASGIAADGTMQTRAFRLGSNDSETSPNNSATGSKVWGDSVLSTNHEAAIDSNDDGEGLADSDMEAEGLESDEDDQMTDIRKIAAFNSLKKFLEDHNLKVFVAIASRKCQGMSIDTLKAKSESQIRQIFCSSSEEESNSIDETDLV